MLLVMTALLCAGSNAEVFTNTERHVADRVAIRNGFVNLGPILGNQTVCHFVHKALPHARNKRSVRHMKILKVDPLVHRTVQQPGFKRAKRRYKPLRVDNLVSLYQMRNPENPGNRDSSDPLFQYQWYLKNTGQNGGKAKVKKAKIIEIRQIYTSRVRAEGSDFLIDFEKVSVKHFENCRTREVPTQFLKNSDEQRKTV